MATILKGAPVVAAMNEANAARCAAMQEKGIVPTLAVVRVGARPDDLSYEKGVLTRCSKVGVAVKQFLLPEDAAQDALLEVIRQINADPSIHGCLLFRPLPRQFDDRAVRAALAPEKDIDGITDGSLAGVFTNTAIGYPPCTAQACMALLRHYGIDSCGRHAVVIGRSPVVGRPVSMLLLRENATVTVCHTKTPDTAALTRQADIIITAAGAVNSLTATHVRPGQTVLDVSMNWNGTALCGDADFPAVSSIVDAITPVPGGVGAVTSAVLMAHTVRAAEYLTGEGGA